MKPVALKWIEIDLAAIARNARWVLGRLKTGTKLMAVVKADGYGHGAAEVSRTALKAGASCLGVRDLDEAAQIRRAGIKAPLHLLAPILPAQAAQAARLDVVATVDSLEQARAIQAAGNGRVIPLHVDVDLGLGRWGVAPRELGPLMAALARLKKVRVEGLSVHVGYIPGKNSVEAEEKLGAFRKLVAPYKRKNPALIARAANSSVLMDFPHRVEDMACIGNLLYGINPSTTRAAALQNPWRFCARILSLREARKGASIGYASEYLAPRRLRIATVLVGYADGLTLEPAGRLIGFGSGFEYWANFGDARLPFLGHCGIGHALLDATEAPGLKVGDIVTLPIRRTAARLIPRIYL